MIWFSNAFGDVSSTLKVAGLAAALAEVSMNFRFRRLSGAKAGASTMQSATPPKRPAYSACRASLSMSNCFGDASAPVPLSQEILTPRAPGIPSRRANSRIHAHGAQLSTCKIADRPCHDHKASNKRPEISGDSRKEYPSDKCAARAAFAFNGAFPAPLRVGPSAALRQQSDPLAPSNSDYGCHPSSGFRARPRAPIPVLGERMELGVRGGCR